MAKRKTSIEDARLLVAAAASGIDLTGHGEDYDFEVARRMLRIKEMLDPDSLPMRIAGSTRIFARIERVEFDVGSKRFFITYRPDFNPRERGHLRSDRTDGKNGAAIRSMWSQPLVGKHVVLFKITETSASARGEDAETRYSGYSPTKSRNCPYVVVLGD